VNKSDFWEAKSLKIPQFSPSYINIKEDKNRVILLSIKSISRCLNIKYKKLIKILLDNDLDFVIRYIRESIFFKNTENLPHTIKIPFEQIIEKFDYKNGHLINKTDGTFTGVTPLEIKLAFYMSTPNHHPYKYWYDLKGKKVGLISKIGRGGYCTVYFYIDLKNKLIGALKTGSKGRRFNTSIEDLNHEFDILQYIHRKGKAWGIQTKPQKKVELLVSSCSDGLRPVKSKIGYLGLKYQNDYLTEITKIQITSIEEILLEFHQLLGGLKVLSNLNIVHGDIKPMNILVAHFDQFKWVHLSDFGGARRGDTEIELSHLIAGGGHKPTSPECYLNEDLQISRQYALFSDRKAVINTEKLRDIFALGCVFYFRLTGYHPVIQGKDGKRLYPNYYHGLDADGKLPELKKLIEGMVSENMYYRPNADLAFNILNDIIREKFPILSAKISKLMFENGFVIPPKEPF
jgi:hypothetical protein